MESPMASEEMNVGGGESTDKKEEAKCCADCKTSKTPLWRGGPSGPKSLCNACGIRYRKKRASVGSSPSDKKRERSGSDSDAGKSGGLISESVKMSLVLLGKDLLMQTSAVAKKQRCQRRKRQLGEEELAAVSLMAMSCGSVFA